MSPMRAPEHNDGLDPSRLERHLPELLQQYVRDATPLAALPPRRQASDSTASQNA